MTETVAGENFELLIVGAGPAGMAAAAEATALGVRTVMVDAANSIGGQFYAQPAGVDRPAALPDDLVAGLRPELLDIRLETSVWGFFDGLFAVRVADRSYRLRPQAVVLATGGYERPLPFPGWDEPSVISPGGVQRLLKVSGVVPGGRVLIAGSGPFLMAVAVDLIAAGVDVCGLVEARRRTQLAGLLPQLVRSGAQRRQALAMRRALAGLPLRFGVAIERVEEGVAHFSDGSRIEADLICVGHGFRPRLSLPHALTLATGAGKVAVDPDQGTSVAGVFAAGEATGIGGSRVAAAEGRVAGAAAAQYLGLRDTRSRQNELRRLLKPEARFAARLDRAYASRPVLAAADPGTTICRCEGVKLGQIEAAVSRAVGAADPRAVKAELRCGMGPCQGLVCEEAVKAAVGWGKADVAGHVPRTRPPISPVSLDALAGAEGQDRG